MQEIFIIKGGNLKLSLFSVFKRDKVLDKLADKDIFINSCYSIITLSNFFPQ